MPTLNFYFLEYPELLNIMRLQILYIRQSLGAD